MNGADEFEESYTYVGRKFKYKHHCIEIIWLSLKEGCNFRISVQDRVVFCPQYTNLARIDECGRVLAICKHHVEKNIAEGVFVKNERGG